MYARTVSFTVQAHHFENARRVLHDEILPAVRRQAGFIDYIALECATEPNCFLSLTLWESKEDAERYHTEEFPKLVGMILPFLAGAAEVREYNVEASTVHRILGRAA